MLKSLKVQAFESWLNAYITFHEGVNVFVGKSDAGKSGIFRAIRWALQNEPSGNKFISDLKKAKKLDTSSCIEFTEEITVLRKREGTKNIYEVDDTELKAFGVGVPELVEQATGITEINIQQQIQQWFLLSETSGKRGEFFNKIAKIDKIDSATKYAESKIRENTRAETVAENEVSRIKEELKNFDYLVQLEKLINTLRTAEQDRDALEKRLQRIKALSEKRDSILEELSQSKYKNISEAEQKLKLIREKEQTRKTLEERLQKIEMLSDRKNEISEELSQSKYKNISEAERKLKSVQELRAKYNQKRMHLSKIERSFQEHRIILTKKENVENELIRKNEEYQKLKPKTCPLCGGNWK